jgi:hypothetical protein
MFAGDILFIILEYLFRLTVFTIRRHRSESWPQTKATITGFTIPKSITGHMVELDYLYYFADERFAGKSKMPFIFRSNAEACMKQFVTGAKIIVRVKPNDPSVSVVHKNYRL